MRWLINISKSLEIKKLNDDKQNGISGCTVSKATGNLMCSITGEASESTILSLKIRKKILILQKHVGDNISNYWCNNRRLLYGPTPYIVHFQMARFTVMIFTFHYSRLLLHQ